MTFFNGSQGIVYFKASVRAATTADITLSGPQTIDAVSVVAGDRVLVKDQSTGANNGIYVVAAGAWTRATDFAQSGSVKSGLVTFVTEGSVNGDKPFWLTTNDPITLGTTSLVFASISGTMAIGGSITSATAGSVLFAGAAGILAQDNANFFWDDSLNRLGLGTASPAKPLHVIGDARVSENLTVGDGDFSTMALGFISSPGTGFYSNAVGHIRAKSSLASAVPMEIVGGIFYLGNAGSGPVLIADTLLNRVKISGTNVSAPDDVLFYVGSGAAATTTHKHTVIEGSMTVGASSVIANSWTMAADGGTGAGTAYPFYMNLTQHNGPSSIVFTIANPSNSTGAFDHRTSDFLVTTGMGAVGSWASTGPSNSTGLAGTQTGLFGHAFTTDSTTATGAALLFGVVGTIGGSGGYAGKSTGKNSTGIGVTGVAVQAKNTASTTEVHVGVEGHALFGNINVGGLFTLGASVPTYVSAALIADNGTEPSSIFIVRDNGTATFTIADGGNWTSTQATWTVVNDMNIVLSGGVNGLSINGTTFSVDATNNRIGIGTATPAAALSVERNNDGNARVSITNTTSGVDAQADLIAFGQNQYIQMNALSDGYTRAYPGFHAASTVLVSAATNGLNIVSGLGSGSAGANTGVIRFITQTSVVGSDVSGNDALTRMTITAVGLVGIGVATPNSVLDVVGSAGFNVTAVSTTTTLTSTHHTVLVDATSGAVTINLPAVAGVTRRRYEVIKTDSSANAVTLDGNASETINGATTFALSTQYQSATIVTDGSAWYVV